MTAVHNSTLNTLHQICYFTWEIPKFLFWTPLSIVPDDKDRDGPQNISLLAIQPHDMTNSLRICIEDMPFKYTHNLDSAR